MEQKIAELTDKLYKDGVEKGEERAKQIAEDAKARAAKIVENARAEAQKIVAEARQQADEAGRNAGSEIKLSGQQAVSAIKQEIVDMIVAKNVDQSIGQLLSDPQVVKGLIEQAVKNWNASEGQAPSLEVLLPEKMRDELGKALESSLMQVMKAGVTLSFGRNIKGGFRIGPQGSSFKVSLTDEDFVEFFKEYLRPGTRALLFGE